MRMIGILAVAVVLAAALWFGANWYAEYRVRTAFAEAGMSDKAAACMGRRLAKHLSFAQLHKLTQLQGQHHSVGKLVKAVREMDDPRIIEVTGTSALLCTSGFAR